MKCRFGLMQTYLPAQRTIAALRARAGIPRTVVRSATSRVTTAPAPTIAPEPMLKILQDLCSRADEHTLSDYDSTRNVCSRIDDRTASDAGFVSERAAEVAKRERFQDDVHCRDHSCSDEASLSEAGRLEIDDGGWMDKCRPGDSVQQGTEFAGEAKSNRRTANADCNCVD